MILIQVIANFTLTIFQESKLTFLIFHVKWLWILFISGHEESYNPPPEYLPTKEEVREMRWIVS